MKTYLVKLTPLEPYFFGNEKTFLFKGEENQGQRGNMYFIRSERTPLQSTLMGMMRYLLMPHKGFDQAYREQNAAVIGEESFDIEAEAQSFGVIERVHPLFLMRGSEKYVVTPMDCSADKTEYTPFSDYKDIETDQGIKKYAADYDVKKGLNDSYISLSDGSLIQADDIFGAETRVGNMKNSGTDNKDSFFKKEYRYFKDGFSFAFYVDLDDSAVLPENGVTHVFLGQGKSLFSASFTEEENTLERQAAKLLSKDIIYCLSDVYTDSGILELCEFAMLPQRDYRVYKTLSDGKVIKGSTLFKLIKAGSVMIAKDKNALLQKITNGNCRKAGFNHVVMREELL